MKIMIVAPYIYDKTMQEFSKNSTGFGIMVNNIIRAIGRLEHVVVITRSITKEKNKKEQGYKILSHTWKDIIFGINLKDLKKAIKIFFKERIKIKDRLRIGFYEIDKGYFRNKLLKENPDIINIHGIGRRTEGYIDICEELGFKYCVTLHGLVGVGDFIDSSPYDKQLEKEFLIKASKKNLPVSVISSGIKKRIEKNYIKEKTNNIKVILNAIPINEIKDLCKKTNIINHKKIDYFIEYKRIIREHGKFMDINKTYDILLEMKKKGRKILFFVGNITKNKNQLQAVDVIRLMIKDKNILLVLWGKECDGGNVRNKIIEYGLEEKIILGGFNDQIDKFWDLCDLNLFLSFSDGFGLPIIEGYLKGKPCIAFKDLDAIEDLNFSSTMITVNRRSTKEVVKQLKFALNKEWDYEIIMAIGKKFSLDEMARNYVGWYKQSGGKKNEN